MITISEIGQKSPITAKSQTCSTTRRPKFGQHGQKWNNFLCKLGQYHSCWWPGSGSLHHQVISNCGGMGYLGQNKLKEMFQSTFHQNTIHNKSTTISIVAMLEMNKVIAYFFFCGPCNLVGRVVKLEYSRKTGSIAWLLMSCLLLLPGHQQLFYFYK